MSNTLLSPTVILRKAGEIFHNMCGFMKNCDRQYDDAFAKKGAKAGTSLRVRKPVQFAVNTGAAINVQDVTEQYVTINCATQKHVDFEFTSADRTMTIDDFAERYLDPAMARLASEIDKDGLLLYQDVYNLLGTAGTTPSTSLIIGQCGARLSDYCTPKNNRYGCLNPIANATVADALKALFHKGSSIASNFETGETSDFYGFKFYEDQNVARHTCGSRSGTILIDDAAGAYNTEGSTSIHVDGLGAATQTFTDGDVFTVSAVYAVNPETKVTSADLQQFVVTTAATAASSEVTLTVSPAMYTSASGALQTISAFPADGATVTVVGTASTAYPQNMLYHKSAFTFASADLELPGGVDFAAREVMDKVSMRIVRQYDITNDNFPCRIDVYGGWTTVRPEWACRLIG